MQKKSKQMKMFAELKGRKEDPLSRIKTVRGTIWRAEGSEIAGGCGVKFDSKSKMKKKTISENVSTLS